MFGLNRNVKIRDKIIFGKYEPATYIGGIKRFENLSLGTLKKLVSLNFISLDDRHNCCPKVINIINFMEKYPDYTALGYAVSAKRADYRVSLEGVSKNSFADTIKEFDDFLYLFRDADEINTDTKMFCWFD